MECRLTLKGLAFIRPQTMIFVRATNIDHTQSCNIKVRNYQCANRPVCCCRFIDFLNPRFVSVREQFSVVDGGAVQSESHDSKESLL